MPKVLDLPTAKKFSEMWRRNGARFEEVGGLFKRKLVLHDIDVLVRTADLAGTKEIISRNKPAVPVEIYIADDDNYAGLRTALRADTFTTIHKRLMTGLHFSKTRIE